MFKFKPWIGYSLIIIALLAGLFQASSWLEAKNSITLAEQELPTVRLTPTLGFSASPSPSPSPLATPLSKKQASLPANNVTPETTSVLDIPAPPITEADTQAAL